MVTIWVDCTQIGPLEDCRREQDLYNWKCSDKTAVEEIKTWKWI